MIRLLALAPLALLAACETGGNAPIVANGPPAADGTAVALQQRVQAGSVVATPLDVAEDSRCPENARCVWAGRLVVKTRIDAGGWRETVDLELGQPTSLRGISLTLVSGLPEKQAERETPPADYRFTFEGGN